MDREKTEIPQLKVKETPANCPVPPPCPVCPPKPKPTQVLLKVLLVLGMALVLAVIILVGSGLRISRKESLLDIWLASRRGISPTPEVLEPTPTPDPTADWKTYVDTKYGFSLKYPSSWQTENASGFFKEGGVFSVLIIGNTQKQETEFYDGARFAVGLPLKTSKTTEEWVKEYYPARNVNDEPNIFSEESINGKVFQKIHTCGLGCYDYFNIINNEYAYRIMTFSGGPEKAKHEKTLNQILSTFKFTQ